MKRLLLVMCSAAAFTALSPAGANASGSNHRAYFQQQDKVVTGKVTDDKGAVVAGATVTVKGKSISAVTKDDGTFSINVPQGAAILTISYVGMLSMDVNVESKTNVTVTLSSAGGTLDDFVVIGYGTKKRANVLGAVGTIDPKEIEDMPFANLTTGLVNKVPGVGVSQSSGKPGSTTTLRIRNPVTFGNSGSVEPLYVIDGIAYPIETGKDFFDNLDATMVESITFLKDAAASIYGSRGANGVVLVTTKKGKPGKPKISYTGSYGISDAVNFPETLTAFEHATLLNNKYLHRPAWNGMVYSEEEMEYLKNNNNNWVDEVWQSSSLQRHAVNVSGGTDKITFFGGANYYNETGNLKDLYATRYGYRVGMNAKVTQDLTFDVTFSSDFSVQDRPTPKNASGFAGQNSDQNDQMNLTMAVLMLNPKWVPMYIDGKPVYQSAPNWHPKEVQNTNSYARTNGKGNNLTASLNYKVPFVDGLSARVSFGQNSRTSLGKEYYASYQLYDFQRLNSSPLTTSGVTKQAVMFTNTPTVSNPVRTIRNGNSLRYSTDENKSYQLNYALNFAKEFGKHDIDVLALAELSETSGVSYFTSRGGGDGPAQGQTVPGVDEFWGFTADRAYWDNSSSAAEGGRASYLGRLNYSYNNKYLLEASFRADASPNFPPGSRWGYFPSVAVGWKVSEEAFFKDNVSFVNDLKMRFQVGQTGSDAVAAWQYYERYTGNGVTGMLFGNVVTTGLNNGVWPNPNITWEKALYKNLGFDGTFFRRKFNFAIDLYHRHNTDMLQTSTSTVPSTFGATIADQNYAEMKSWGVEASLGYNGKITKDLGFSIQGNFGWSDNKVIKKYYNEGADTAWKNPIGRRTDNGIEGYRSTFIFRTQADIDAWYAKNPGWKINGDSARLGYMNYEDVNGDGQITELDKTRIAPRSGNLFGIGLNFGLSWKGFKFSINSSLMVGGNSVWDRSALRPPTEGMGGLAFWKDSWSPSNPNAKYPVINAPLISESSNFWMVSATSWRVNNAQLSYALPAATAAKWKIPELRMFVTGTNLGNIINNHPYKSGFTNIAVDYPALRTITFGMNVSL